jgi:chromate reductase
MLKKKIFAISGSTRTNSSNLSLIKAIEKLTTDKLVFTIFNGLDTLPHFNPDIDGNEIDSVRDFRAQVLESDAVLICTPEYAHGVPGSLKNVIDWTVGSGEFSQKPTVLITASTDGQIGHEALLETLRVIETKNIDELNLLIQFVRTKINAESEITDEKTKVAILNLIEKLIVVI